MPARFYAPSFHPANAPYPHNRRAFSPFSYAGQLFPLFFHAMPNTRSAHFPTGFQPARQKKAAGCLNLSRFFEVR
ncbi:MAG: hypothetical protein D6714_15545 [Bacteroidetes bacterium]|nr:MAG: hypothetical protein D6714_15545 [Bacteroidota bacterium]